MSRHATFQIVLLGLAASACRTGVAGRYELDVEETKVCVAKAALDNPEDAKMKDETIKLLQATTVDLLLDEVGMMSSTTVLTGEGPPTPQKRFGSWRTDADAKRVVIKVEGEQDTLCDVDSKRLRCKKPTQYKLFSNYVLVRK